MIEENKLFEIGEQIDFMGYALYIAKIQNPRYYPAIPEKNLEEYGTKKFTYYAHYCLLKSDGTFLNIPTSDCSWSKYFIFTSDHVNSGLVSKINKQTKELPFDNFMPNVNFKLIKGHLIEII